MALFDIFADLLNVWLMYLCSQIRSASAFSPLHCHMLCSLWKTSLNTYERMCVKKANTVLGLSKLFSDLAEVLGPHFENWCIRVIL